MIFFLNKEKLQLNAWLEHNYIITKKTYDWILLSKLFLVCCYGICYNLSLSHFYFREKPTWFKGSFIFLQWRDGRFWPAKSFIFFIMKKKNYIKNNIKPKKKGPATSFHFYLSHLIFSLLLLLNYCSTKHTTSLLRTSVNTAFYLFILFQLNNVHIKGL